MGQLPEPHFQARAVARMIAARARSIADLGDKIAAIERGNALAPEEWAITTASFESLFKELQAELASFDNHAKHLM